jgi:DNA primase
MAERATGDSYTENQVRATIESIGIDVVGQTYSDFLCYCPFHDNTDTPAFTVGSENGLYICHNASCRGNEGGNLVKLVLLLSDRGIMEARRMIAKKGSETAVPLAAKIDAQLTEQKWPMLPQLKVDELVGFFWQTPEALAYMREERKFNDETLRAFEVGFEPTRQMVVVPIHDIDGNPIGVNGRSITAKQFKLTRRIPRNLVLFNMHRAKRAGGTAIICESQFDVMRIHQAGFPNAVCSFGSHISKHQVALLQRYFDRVIIMFDADGAGRKAGHTLSAALRGSTKVEWAIWDWGVIYPHDAKDAGDMTDEEIKHCINNAVSDLEYKSYKALA